MLADAAKFRSRSRLLAHARDSRRALRSAIDLQSNIRAWEETCVPSYCHPNLAAATVSWLRLMKAVELADSLGAVGPVLDFGSGTGELGRLLNTAVTYDFVEQDDAAAEYLMQKLPTATRQSLDSAPIGHYGSVFALDSLEHNDDFVDLLSRLCQKLMPGGILIISGPTENTLYRVGRRIAGFSAHYHKTTVREIESAAAGNLRQLATSVLPARFAPLFRISGWTTPAIA